MKSSLQNDKSIATEDYFLLASRSWDDKIEDFFPVNDPSTTIQTFSEYAKAESAYFSKDYAGCTNSGTKEVKKELIHMRFGTPHMIRNQILFP